MPLPKKIPGFAHFKSHLWLGLLFFLFGLVPVCWPVYSDDQNMYLLHGLVSGGYGLFKRDWLVFTADPMPLFSGLIALTYRYLPEFFFYLYQIAFAGLYFAGLVGITAKTTGIAKSHTAFRAYLAVLAAVHSYLLYKISYVFFGQNIFFLLTRGVSGVFLLGPVFQPGAFASLFLLSIYEYLSRRVFRAVFLLAAAAVFHPAYLFTAAALTASYMVLEVIENQEWQRAFWLGLFALTLILPAVLYLCFVFAPASAEMMQQAQSILIHERMGPYLDYRQWFLSWSAAFKMAWMILAIALVPSFRLRVIMGVMLAAGAAFTVLHLMTGSGYLALIMPWRVSALLMPVSTSVLIAVFLRQIIVLRRLNKITRRGIERISLVVFFFLIAAGAGKTLYASFAGNRMPADYLKMQDYVKTHHTEEDLYLLPPDLRYQDFRLQTRASIFVSFKTHPYKDVEVLEWYKRVQLANDFYGYQTHLNCQKLDALKQRYGITHVIFSGPFDAPCESLEPEYREGRYAILKLKN